MDGRTRSARVLVYCRDSLGLADLQRCRAVAHALVDRRAGLSVLIVSGSPIIGAYEFRPRVDFVRIPGITRHRGGEYASLNLDMDVSWLVDLRARIFHQTALAFRPDLVIVDQAPLGLRGEIAATLEMLKARGTPLVLGLPDVLGEPEALGRAWGQRGLMRALGELYDEIWIHGSRRVCDPLAGLDLPAAVRARCTYTGYLRRTLSGEPPRYRPFGGEPYLLASTGGGAYSDALIDRLLAAYEADPDIPYPMVIVYGPFLSGRRRRRFDARIAGLDRVRAIDFDPRAEWLVGEALGVISLGGYDSFCEILSFDRPALLAPCTGPGREPHIRSARAAALGLARALPDAAWRDPAWIAEEIRALPGRPRPSHALTPEMLGGPEEVGRLTARWLDGPAAEWRRTSALPA